jgi:hypothetical protein
MGSVAPLHNDDPESPPPRPVAAFASGNGAVRAPAASPSKLAVLAWEDRFGFFNPHLTAQSYWTSPDSPFRGLLLLLCFALLLLACTLLSLLVMLIQCAAIYICSYFFQQLFWDSDDTKSIVCQLLFPLFSGTVITASRMSAAQCDVAKTVQGRADKLSLLVFMQFRKHSTVDS